MRWWSWRCKEWGVLEKHKHCTYCLPQILCVMDLEAFYYFVGGAEQAPLPAQNGTEPKSGE